MTMTQIMANTANNQQKVTGVVTVTTHHDDNSLTMINSKRSVSVLYSKSMFLGKARSFLTPDQ